CAESKAFISLSFPNKCNTA
ncbi:hypothetical protein D030_1922B, partial [Vibrio parahaemolyticus AQ3810]